MTTTASSNLRLQRNSDIRCNGFRLFRAVSVWAFVLIALISAPAGRLAAQDTGQPQQSAVLVVDFDEVFRQSGYGREIQQLFENRSRALAEEIALIDAEMAAEEKALTEQRAGLSAEEFRTLADAFDVKVQLLRDQQDEKARALAREQSEAQLGFRQTALPVLGQMMLENGASVVVEKRNVLVFSDSIDVSRKTAERLDAILAAREAQNTGQDTTPQTPSEDAPAANE